MEKGSKLIKNYEGQRKGIDPCGWIKYWREDVIVAVITIRQAGWVTPSSVEATWLAHHTGDYTDYQIVQATINKKFC
jgi:hypothetical protein